MTDDIAGLVSAARCGSTRAAGRLLSLVESPRRDEVLAAITATAVPVVGITGPPGAGKSTTVAALVTAYRERDARVAVLAVTVDDILEHFIIDPLPRNHGERVAKGLESFWARERCSSGHCMAPEFLEDIRAAPSNLFKGIFEVKSWDRAARTLCFTVCQ